jgi:hypothetical protein
VYVSATSTAVPPPAEEHCGGSFRTNAESETPCARRPAAAVPRDGHTVGGRLHVQSLNSEDRRSSYEEHTVDALAPRAEEGRGVAAISLGELLASVDPGISEWGNPPGVVSRYSRLNT